MYLLSDAGEVVAMLRAHGINSEVIGNIARTGFSEHDIDIWIKEQDTKKTRDFIVFLLKPQEVLNTDWEGMYLKRTPFGDVDIFMRIDNLDYL